MYKFDVLAIARVVCCVALRKYKIKSTGNRIYEKPIFYFNLVPNVEHKACKNIKLI
jgi:hypothetical protein